MTIVELQLPTENNELKYVTMKPWEIDFISGHNSSPYNSVTLQTVEGDIYHPIQVNFRKERL